MKTAELAGLVLLGAGLGIPAILYNIRLAPRLGLIDWPKARGVAEEQIPLIGGSLVLLSLVALAALSHFYGLRPWLITSGVIMAVMGLLDDRKPLASLDKFFFQLLCVCAMVFLDPFLHEALTARYGGWGTFWAVFFILGLTNGINFIDGIDGLAGLVIFFGALSLVLISPSGWQDSTQVMFAAFTMGLLLPFLYFNVKRRRGFLGNVGSYFFGYMLGVMHLSVPFETSDPVSRISLTGLCFLVPIADGVMVCLLRVLSFRSPLQADKGHLHHRLIQTCMPLRFILGNFALITSGAMCVAVLLARSPHALRTMMPFYLCLSHVGLSAVLIFLVERASRQRLRYHFERLSTKEPVFYLRYRLHRGDGRKPSFIQMRRLEAAICSEIRITDMCFREAENELALTLRTTHDALDGILERLDGVFRREQVQVEMSLEEGRFVRVVGPALKPAPASGQDAQAAKPAKGKKLSVSA